MEYVKNVINEMKMVSWPTKAVVWESTKIVIGISLILVAYIFMSDQALNWVVGMLIS